MVGPSYTFHFRWGQKSPSLTLSENIDNNLKLVIVFACTSIFHCVVRQAAKLAKICKLAIKFNLEHNFDPNMIITIQYIK